MESGIPSDFDEIEFENRMSQRVKTWWEEVSGVRFEIMIGAIIGTVPGCHLGYCTLINGKCQIAVCVNGKAANHDLMIQLAIKRLKAVFGRQFEIDFYVFQNRAE